MQPLTKRQREILDYLNEFIQQHGYAPSLEEIGERFSLSSLATVHKHLTNLQEKGFISRSWNRSRSVELLPSRTGGRAIELPMLGYVAAGMPIEAIAGTETIGVPESLVSGKRDTYVLRVSGDSMIDEQIRDGDWVVVEDRKTADNGEMVMALVGGQDVDAQEVLPGSGPHPPAAGQSDDAADLRRPGRRADPGRGRRRDAEVLSAASASTDRSSGHDRPQADQLHHRARRRPGPSRAPTPTSARWPTRRSTSRSPSARCSRSRRTKSARPRPNTWCARRPGPHRAAGAVRVHADRGAAGEPAHLFGVARAGAASRAAGQRAGPLERTCSR